MLLWLASLASSSFHSGSCRITRTPRARIHATTGAPSSPPNTQCAEKPPWRLAEFTAAFSMGS